MKKYILGVLLSLSGTALLSIESDDSNPPHQGSEVESLVGRLGKVTEKLNELTGKYDELKDRFRNQRSQAETLTEAFSAAQNEAASQVAENEDLKRQLARLKKKYAVLKANTPLRRSSRIAARCADKFGRKLRKKQGSWK